MKTRKNIARLLSFLMVLSLLLGIYAAPVYAVGGEGETASFEIREANGQTGTVQYKLDNGDFTVADSTPVNLNGVSSITIKATPIGEAQVNQSTSGIAGTEQAVSFDYAALTNESGWTYQIQDNDGNITFTIEFDNHDGTGGGSNPGGGGTPPQVEGPAIVFSADSNADGTITVSNGIFTLSNDTSVLGTVQVTLIDALNNETPYNGNDEAIPLNDVSSVRIVMSPAEGLNAALVTPGDTPAGALSGPVDDEQENTCTYIAYPAHFGDSLVLQAFIWFGDEFVGDGSDAPVIWDGPQVENLSANGSISVSSIEIGSKTYTYQGEGKFAHNGDEIEQLEWYGYNKTSIAEEGGIRVYGDVFTEENVGVFYINFEFKPDYGYQATHVRMTEDDPIPLSDAGFSAAEAIRTFRFAVYPEAHTHFSVIFTATEDIVKANAASISEGGVELAAGELDGGSAVLEVNGANITNQGDFEAAAEGYVVSEYLDISLYNVFYKGNAEDVWSTPVENLDNPAEITLRLEDGIDTENVKIVHEKGVGEFELLDADYNPGTQEITFSTSSFSNYAIAYEEQAQDRYFIDFTNAPWTVDGVEVDLEGREPDAELMVWITTEDVIPLTNFDPDTMDAVLIVDEDVTLRLNVDENGNTRLADVDGSVEVLPPYGAMMIFSVVKKPVDNEEFETESYTLTDDKGNAISLTYEKSRELSFTMIDYLAFSPEELESMGIPQGLYNSMMEGIVNATKQHGTLLSLYEIQVENDDGFLIHEGPFNIKIKMTDEMKKYDIFKIVYVDAEDNFATEAPITLTRDGEYLVGTLEHLSTYALVGSNTPSSPQTGDNSNLGLWVFLLVLSSCSMIALIVIDKKRKIAK